MIYLFSLCVAYHYQACTLLVHWWSEILSDSFVLDAWILKWVPSTSREPSLVVKPSLDYLQFGGRRQQNDFASDRSFTTLETEDFGRPTVSPMGCRKLPLTKKCNATRICSSVGDSASFLFVHRCRSFSRISVRNSIESRPNRYLIRSSSSEKSSRKISCWRNIFSRIFRGITGISKSAILCVLTNFDLLYSPINGLIDLARCVKFNP